MGFLNDMRKLLFGAKSVTKSATRKASDASRQRREDLQAKAEEVMEQAGEQVENLKDTGEQINQQTNEFIAMAKDKWEELEDELRQRRQQQNTGDQPASSQTGDGEEDDVFSDLNLDDDSSPSEEGPDFEEKKRRREAYREFKAKADDVANRLLDVSDEAGRRFMNLSERVGKQLFSKGGSAFEKAKAYADQLLDRADTFAEKAQSDSKSDLDEMLEQVEKLNKTMEERLKSTKDRFAGRSTKDTDSLLDDKDDFFARAKRFAEGDYHNEGAREDAEIGEMEIWKDPDFQPKEESQNPVYGFEDLDGDGDEIIDDAILDFSDEPDSTSQEEDKKEDKEEDKK